GLKRTGLPLARRRAVWAIGEQIERVAHRAVITGAAGALRGHVGRRAGAALRSHLPGRAVAGQRLLLEAGDVGIRHAGEVVETLVVFADMRETEAEILAFLQASHRRAVRARLATAIP